ncbi:MAG: hypothetical protein J6B45_02140 [Clostridia bacterium]|nr:hypothetical protein [Clostridia bacterium]
MKKSKFFRILVLMLAFCLLATSLFTACGNKDKDDDDDEEEEEEEGDKENDKAAEGRDEFIDEIGGVSDTYVGSVSDETYVYAEEAASAYVEFELAGDSYVEVDEVISKGELSSSEINKLNLPSELTDGLDAVEKFEVYYEIYDEETYSTASAQAKDPRTKVIVYVIRYGEDYKYYTPCPVNGETITRSYYDSVFDNERFENCTFVKESTVTVKQNGVAYEMVLKQTIKRADNKIFFEQTIDGDEVLTGQFTNQSYMAAYIETDEDGYDTTYVKTSIEAGWTEGYLTGVNAETLVPFYDQYLDYTYFSKTNFGFALKDENAVKYYREAAGANAGSAQYLDDADLELYAEYYVSDGVLSGMRMEYNAEIDTKISGVRVQSTTIGENKMTCTDYGTTIVEKPF